MRRTILIVGCIALVLASGLGCSDSTTAPEPPGSTPVSFQDVPAIPVPTSPGGSVPPTSDVHTTIRPLDGNFRAFVARAKGDWVVDYRISTLSNWINVDKRSGWSDQTFNAVIQLGNPVGYMLMVENGSPKAKVVGEFNRIQTILETRYRFSGPGLSEAVYLRRDRQWELKTLEGGIGDFLLLEGNVQGTVSTSYTRGSSRTDTEEFGRSLTVSAGAGYGPLSVSVSGTLSQTFSTSITVDESRTETFEKSVSGEPGKIIQFQVWELVDRYSFCDANGDPLSHTDYVFDNATWTRHGSASFLQTTVFDKP